MSNLNLNFKNTILYSPLSLESVPSISNITMLLLGFYDIHTPLVVYYLPFEKSMVSNPVLNSKFKRVPMNKYEIRIYLLLLFPLL